jgi:hypothetical protein
MGHSVSKVPSKVFSDLIEETLSVLIDGDGTTEGRAGFVLL